MSGAALSSGQLTPDQRAKVLSHVRGQPWLPLGILVAALVYLIYSLIAMDVVGLINRSSPERAVILGTDSVAHKVHVTKNLRRDELEIAIEGERTATYDNEAPPDWVQVGDAVTSVDLGDGYTVEIEGQAVRFFVPDYGLIDIAVRNGEVETLLPGPAPDWMKVSEKRFDGRPTLLKRVQVSRAKIEVHRYFFGWENFFFPFRSELRQYSTGELFDLAFSGRRLQPDMPNWRYMLDTFLGNQDWQHGEVLKAIFETILMAVLGTFTAAFVGLPLAFLAAANFTPSMVIRFFIRRVFDFLRGIDMLIWSLIFIRAFGLGPLTGALAIAFTDTGTLGKLFSEALENIDNKQVEGVRSTGANRLQRYRFGVIPQILPVLVSQGLYYLESNTRSATVIGALGAGGIGLLLVETMRTARDWENTLYLILLTIILVIAMDSFSSWLRRKLIYGS